MSWINNNQAGQYWKACSIFEPTYYEGTYLQSIYKSFGFKQKTHKNTNAKRNRKHRENIYRVTNKKQKCKISNKRRTNIKGEGKREKTEKKKHSK